MKKPLNDPDKIPGTLDVADAAFINPDAPTGPGPEPSLALRMARSTMNDAFQTGAAPFEGDVGRDEAMPPAPAGMSGQIESQPAGERGGRVDAVGATYGRDDRAGAAAAGVPVQSVGAAMTTPSLPGPGDISTDDASTLSTHAPERNVPAEADRR